MAALCRSGRALFVSRRSGWTIFCGSREIFRWQWWKRRRLTRPPQRVGKRVVAFQICWKLWSARWNRTGEYRRPRILYLADRNILVDQPKDGMFAAFSDARYKIEGGEIIKSREMYFAIYQALAEDERRF